MTDTDKTLLALQEAGEIGVHSFQLNHIVGTIRAAARINDLKKQGYLISSQPETMGSARGVRYFLVSSPGRKQTEQSKPRFTFDAVRKVYVEVREALTQPQVRPVQEALF